MIAAGVMVSACGGQIPADFTQSAGEPPAATDALDAGPDAFVLVPAGGAAKAALRLEYSLADDQLSVDIVSDGRQALNALLVDLRYDASRFSPLAAQSTDALAPRSDSLCLQLLDTPGVVSIGQVPLSTGTTDLAAGQTLATVLFALEPNQSAARAVMAVPVHNGALSPMVWNPTAEAFNWYYVNPGDYNQDGLVGVGDLVPLGRNLGQAGPFEFAEAMSAIDGNKDDAITISDLSVIGVRYQNRVEGYNVYASSNVADIPTGFADVSLLEPVASYPLDQGLGDVLADRLMFAHTPEETQLELLFWVRPYAGADEGTRSNICATTLDVPPGSGGFNLPPEARLGVEYTGTTVPLNVTFDATGSSDADGQIVFYEWDFEGDGLYDSFSTGAVALHTYIQPGTYEPLVRVTDDGGLWDTFQLPAFTVTTTAVTNIPPVADLAATQTSGLAPLTVGLLAMGSTDPDGAIVKYEWDFDGDGEYDLDSGADPSVLYTYLASGIYTPVVRVTDNGGATATASTELTATDLPIIIDPMPPNALLTANTAYCYIPETLTLDASASVDPDGDILRYWWDWDGDGLFEGFTLTPIVEHEFDWFGFINIGLAVEDDDGMLASTHYLLIANPLMTGPGPWWSAGRDRQNTKRSLISGPLATTQTVNYSSLDQVSGPVVDENGYLYVGGDLGSVSCLYGLFTFEIWSYSTGSGVTPTPALGADGSVYASAENELVALNSDGSFQWSHVISGQGGIPVVASDGSILVATDAGMLYSIAPDNSESWTVPFGEAVFPTMPVLDFADNMFICSGSHLFKISSSGQAMAFFSAPDDLAAPPAIGPDGKIYVGCADGRLYAINADNTLAWSYDTGAEIRTSPALGADGTVYINSSDHGLNAIDYRGELLWRKSVCNADTSPAIDGSGNIFVASFDKKVFCLFPDGDLNQTFSLTSDIVSSPVIGSSGMYVSCANGRLYGFGP